MVSGGSRSVQRLSSFGDARTRLLAVARRVPDPLSAADLPWVHWLLRRIELLVQQYRSARAARLAGSVSAVHKAATLSMFQLAVAPLERERTELRRRIDACAPAAPGDTVVRLPAFLPRRLDDCVPPLL